MSLRARLILALLTMALLPTAAFTLFTLDQLGRSTEHWFRPGVDRALESAIEVSKHSLTRLEAGVLAGAERWATDWPSGSPAGAQRTALRAALSDQGLDFIQVYRPEGAGWRLQDQIAPAGVIVASPPALDDEIAAALSNGHVVRSARGVLGGVALTTDGRALLAGTWVPPDFFAQVAEVERGATFYRRLGVVVSVQRQYVWMLVSVLVFALAALALWLATALARGMSRPLRDLSAALEHVAAGELDTRLEPAGARELRRLGESFNVMTGRLEQARDQLKQAEREAAWREVARRLAHEFKNILTPMSLSLHRLTRRSESVAAGEREAVRESLGALSRGVDQLARLSEQFSQYARLPDPRFEILDLSEVVRDAALLHEPEHARVEFHGGGRLAIRGDSLLLARAIHNLVLNACEASAAGAAIEVLTRAEGDRALVEVLDRGPGVPEALIAQVFEPYVSTKQRGSGLGLALVRDIAQQHHGSASLENRGGGGACARLELPRLGEDGPEAAKA